MTTHDCKHLLIDAGHISIESELADKGAIRAIQLKRNRQYTDEDYQQLESLMYDKLTIRVKAAQVRVGRIHLLRISLQILQFILGNDLRSCRDALTSDAHDSLHLLERVNLDLLAQHSIVPAALNITRFKVSGHLPTLQVNLSDTKYKSLMRLIDVCIPKLGGDSQAQASLPERPTAGPFQLSSGLFGQAEVEYNVDDDDEEEGNEDADSQKETFFEAHDGMSEVCLRCLVALQVITDFPW